MKSFTNFLTRIGCVTMTVCFLATGVSPVFAATGDELLTESLDSSDVNRSVIDCDSLRVAVNKAVAANRKSAAEIVGAAVLKTNSCGCRKDIVENAILALGDYRELDKNLIPNLVAAAIRNTVGDRKDGYDKAGYAKDDGCACAEELTKAAILALGKDPSEDMVTRIVSSAVKAVGADCASRIVDAASQVAPQYASSIADAGANAFAGDPGISDALVFTPTGSLNAPGAFFPPSAPNGGITNPTTPVN